MTALIRSFSLPPWLCLGAGFFVGALIFKDGVRREWDAFAARLFGMKPRERGE